MKFSTKPAKPVTRASGMRKQLRALPGGGKVRSIQTPKIGCQVGVWPVAPTPSKVKISLKPSGKVTQLTQAKQCCGKAVAKAKGAKCPKCGTAWGKIASPVGTLRSSARWFQKVLPPAQQKSWVTSPKGATFPGSGAWLTTAQLSAATAFMQQGGRL